MYKTIEDSVRNFPENSRCCYLNLIAFPINTIRQEANKRQNKEPTAIEKNLILFFAMHFPIQGQ